MTPGSRTRGEGEQPTGRMGGSNGGTRARGLGERYWRRCSPSSASTPTAITVDQFRGAGHHLRGFLMQPYCQHKTLTGCVRVAYRTDEEGFDPEGTASAGYATGISVHIRARNEGARIFAEAGRSSRDADERAADLYAERSTAGTARRSS